MIMKKLCLLLFFFSSHVFAVYGVDGRVERYQIKDKKVLELSLAMAYQVERHYELRGWTFNRLWTIVTRPYQEQKLCPDQKYLKQPSMRKNCTGILVAPDKLLTAGNCLTEHYCWNDLYYWMFDYNLKEEGAFSQKRPKKNFYKCKEVIKRVYDPAKEQSFALIRLNKKVKGVKPVKINFDSMLTQDEAVLVMGHMRGLPLKIDKSAKIILNHNKDYFINSDLPGFYTKGGGVFNAKTLELEGILVHGSKGYWPRSNGCLAEELLDDEDGFEYVQSLKALRPYL